MKVHQVVCLNMLSLYKIIKKSKVVFKSSLKIDHSFLGPQSWTDQDSLDDEPNFPWDYKNILDLEDVQGFKIKIGRRT